MFWRNPKAHVFAKHEPRLGFKCRNRTKEYNSDRYQYPLDEHGKFIDPFVLFGALGKKLIAMVREKENAKHGDRHDSLV